MKFTLRFIAPLLFALGLLAYGLVPLVDRLTTQWFVRDLDIRTKLISSELQEPVAQLLLDPSPEARLSALTHLNKATGNERLLAIGVCTARGQLLLATELFPKAFSCQDIRGLNPFQGRVLKAEHGDVHLAFGDIEGQPNGAGQSSILGRLLVLHDMSFAAKRSEETKAYLFYVFLAVGALVAGVTILIARWSMFSWIKSVRQLVGFIRSPGSQTEVPIEHREFLPILRDLKSLVRNLEATSRDRDEGQINWSAAALRDILAHEFAGDEVIVVANREPYIHNRKDNGEIVVNSPASGLVTAVEPILRACSGVWIAHGSGSADKDVVDQRDRVRVPPDDPQYDIHRIWLSKEEQKGYYYGFANEGLWPLCHIAHTRPVFRAKDWEHYVAVNQKFTEAVVADAKTEDPVVLVQDYHFALVPKMLRERLPKATIITFWHIPWCNPESFGICPWREEILEGLLGSTILGFHTQFHCNNFLDAVDRFVESRIDRETNSVSYGGHITDIRPYPISIEWPPQRLKHIPDVATCRREIREELKVPADLKLGVGVDRLDYTKGIVERLRSVERLMELKPEWIGRFSFVQIAAPSRSEISSYQQFDQEVRSVADEINQRFGQGDYQPVVLKIEHHAAQEVFRYFRAAEVCLVSSLHDGMNLVAKEFVATRDDERGALILSMFAGASRELPEALIVNPYDTDQMALALHSSISMPEAEQQERMRAMRAIVKEYNVFRWAGRMLLDAAVVRRRTRFASMIEASRSKKPVFGRGADSATVSRKSGGGV